MKWDWLFLILALHNLHTKDFFTMSSMNFHLCGQPSKRTGNSLVYLSLVPNVCRFYGYSFHEPSWLCRFEGCSHNIFRSTQPYWEDHFVEFSIFTEEPGVVFCNHAKLMSFNAELETLELMIVWWPDDHTNHPSDWPRFLLEFSLLITSLSVTWNNYFQAWILLDWGYLLTVILPALFLYAQFSFRVP